MLPPVGPCATLATTGAFQKAACDLSTRSGGGENFSEHAARWAPAVTSQTAGHTFPVSAVR